MKNLIKIRNIKNFRRQDGFTFVEMMLSVAVMSIITGGLFSALSVGEGSWKVNTTKITLQQDLRTSMDWMKYDLQEAGLTSIVDVPADDAWYPSITFQVPSGILGGSINWNANSIQFIQGGSDSTDLYRIQNSVTKVLGGNIKTLQFRRLSTSSDIVEVVMIGERDTTSGITVTYQMDFDVALRN
ncbi:MAG: prepilin-type N-terminal cleavage/methylation domain-containing protein [Lysobacterales bacterium]|jgi:prepilin-type N-terminal cleavage/methylation domain-containing protein